MALRWNENRYDNDSPVSTTTGISSTRPSSTRDVSSGTGSETAPTSTHGMHFDCCCSDTETATPVENTTKISSATTSSPTSTSGKTSLSSSPQSQSVHLSGSNASSLNDHVCRLYNHVCRLYKLDCEFVNIQPYDKIRFCSVTRCANLLTCCPVCHSCCITGAPIGTVCGSVASCVAFVITLVILGGY